MIAMDKMKYQSFSHIVVPPYIVNIDACICNEINMKEYLNKISVTIILSFLPISKSFSHNQSLIINKANYVAGLSYEKDLTTSVVWGRADTEIISSFLNIYYGSVVLIPLQNNDRDNVKHILKETGCKQTIFFVTDTEEFEYLTMLLYELIVFPIRLITVVTEEISKESLEYMTSTAWTHDLADIMILSTNENGKVNISTYFPYSGRVCGDNTLVEITRMDENMFQNKFSNFYGCPIKMSVYSIVPYLGYTIVNDTIVAMTGIDGDFFTYIKDKLNATMTAVSFQDRGGIGTYINGTATGIFANLIYKRIDLFMPAGLLDYMSYPVTQVTHAYKVVTLMWLGPQRRKVPQWFRIVLPLMTKFTPALIVTFTSFVVCVLIVKRCSRHKISSKHSLFFETFVIFLEQGANYETKSWLLNSLFIIWIWFCMIIRIIYQGNLVDGLQKTILEKPLNSFEEAAEIIHDYSGPINLREYYRGTKYFSHFKLIPPNLNQELLKNISMGENRMIMTDLTGGFYVNVNLQIIGSPIVRAPAGIFVRPGWAAFENINRIVLQIIEMGYVEKLFKDYESKKHLHNDKHRSASPLDKDTFIGCFYGLGIMYVVYFIVFLIEIAYYCLKKKNR